MKILLVSTSDRIGGAAIACYRIFKAMKNNGYDVSMLVRDKVSNEPGIYSVNTNGFQKLKNFIAFCAERMQILFNNGFNKKHLFEVSTGRFGVNLINNLLVKEADIINFHWVNQGMLSNRVLRKLTKQGKKFVFTMHDMYNFTGICHYTRNCENFKKGCGNCLFIHKGKKADDLSKKIFNLKLNTPGRENFKFIACSKWLKNIAVTSKMMWEKNVIDIPNPIDTEVFKIQNKKAAKTAFGITSKFAILFGAANFNDERKGMNYLIEALKIIYAHNPENEKIIQLVVFGKGKVNVLLNNQPFEVVTAGYIRDESEMARLYAAADIFISPSLEDNLPNTVMEALATGTPCVGFNIGGLPELIKDGQNGYLAQPHNASHLAECIEKILFLEDKDRLSQNARNFVEENFSEPVVAMKYNNVFRAAVPV